MSTAPSSKRRAAFTPKARGDLSEALRSAENFLGIAPSVPRSVAWLKDLTLAHTPGVTARDHALFETLIALTSKGDETEDTIRAARLCSVKQALAVLSAGGHVAQPRELVASLQRLFGRKPEPLKLGGMFHFHLPAWAVPLQQPGRRYGHLDLSVLAQFRRRSSPLLYTLILAHIAANRIRYDTGVPPFEMKFTPSRLGHCLGMPESVHVGQMRLRYLGPALEEIAEHVRSFEIVSVVDTIESRAVKEITLTIRMCPPERLDAVPTRLLTTETFSFLSQRGDAPGYRVKASTLIRLGSTLPSTVMRRKKRGGAHPLLASEMHQRYDTWLAALHEALTGEAITPECETGALRGPRLLAAIKRDGPDRAFFAFSIGEAESPDVWPAIREQHVFVRKVDAARKARAKAARADADRERRRDVTVARREGIMPPGVKRVTESRRPAIMPIEQPKPVAVPSVSVDLTALQSPAGRAEGERLFRMWQNAFEFPFRHAHKTVERVRAAFANGDFPILAEVDRSIGDLYLRSIGSLLKISPDSIPGTSAREMDDNASAYVSLLAKWWPNRVSVGRSFDPAGEIHSDRESYLRDRRSHIQKLRDAHAAATKAKAKRAVPLAPPAGDGFRAGFTPKRAFPL